MNEDTSNIKNNKDESSFSPEEKVKSKRFTIDQDEWEDYLSSKVIVKAFKIISTVGVIIIAVLGVFGYNTISDAEKMTQNAKEDIEKKMVIIDSLVNKSSSLIKDLESSMKDVTAEAARIEKTQDAYSSLIDNYMEMMLNQAMTSNSRIEKSVAEVTNFKSDLDKKQKEIDDKLEDYKNLQTKYNSLEELIQDSLDQNLKMVKDLSKLVNEKLVPELILVKEGEYGVSKVANIRMTYEDADSKEYIKSLQIVDLEARRGDNAELKKYKTQIKKDTSIVFSDLDKNRYSFKINFIESGQEKKQGNYIVIEVNKFDK